VPWFEQGRLLLHPKIAKVDYEGREIDLTKAFVEEEYKAFPVAHHDDMLDALARFLEEDLPIRFPLTRRTWMRTNTNTRPGATRRLATEGYFARTRRMWRGDTEGDLKWARLTSTALGDRRPHAWRHGAVARPRPRSTAQPHRLRARIVPPARPSPPPGASRQQDHSARHRGGVGRHAPRQLRAAAPSSFLVSVIATSNSHIVKVANASDTMTGMIMAVSDDAGFPVKGYTADATAGADTITLNRTTTGSTVKGEWITVEDVAANKWAVAA
jgi:hypothetical protein